MALLIRDVRDRVANLPWRIARLGTAGGGRAIGVLTIWWGWERLAHRRAAPQPAQPGAVFCYSRMTYAGPPLTLQDGTPIRPGDRLLELHFDNRTLLDRATSGRWPPWSALRLMADDLDVLAQQARAGSFDDVVALYGVSLFAQEGPWLGFEFRTLPQTWIWCLVHFYLVGLAAIYHPHGWRAAAPLREERWPGEIWLSLAALRQRQPRSAPPGRRKSDRRAARPPAPGSGASAGGAGAEPSV